MKTPAGAERVRRTYERQTRHISENIAQQDVRAQGAEAATGADDGPPHPVSGRAAASSSTNHMPVLGQAAPAVEQAHGNDLNQDARHPVRSRLPAHSCGAPTQTQGFQDQSEAATLVERAGR